MAVGTAERATMAVLEKATGEPLGHVDGDANLEEFTERRWVSLQRAAVEYPY